MLYIVYKQNNFVNPLLTYPPANPLRQIFSEANRQELSYKISLGSTYKRIGPTLVRRAEIVRCC